MRFDLESAKLQFFSNKAKPRHLTPSKARPSDDVIAVNNRWILEEEFDLDEVAGLVLPDITTKMLKARLKDFYQPAQFGVYNQAELCYMEECEYFLFNLDLMDKGRLECLVDNYASFLDIYSGVSFLQH